MKQDKNPVFRIKISGIRFIVNRVILLLLGFLLHFNFLYSQGIHQQFDITNTLRFSVINSENGLPQNTVQSILSAKDGRIWIGTQSGLCTYNGRNTELILPSKKHPESLGMNLIFALHEDLKGNIWCGSDNGLLAKISFRPNQESKVKVFHLPYSNKHIQYSGLIRAILHDKDNRIWIMLNQVLYVIKDNEIIKKVEIPMSEMGGSLTINDKNEILYVDKNGMITVVNSLNFTVKLFKYNRVITKNYSEAKFNIIFSRNHQILCGWNTLTIFDTKNYIAYEMYDYIFENRKFTPINIVTAGFLKPYIWMGTSNSGLLGYNYKTNGFYDFSQIAGRPHSFPQNQVTSIATDSSGIVWCGTLSSGLCFFKLDHLNAGFHSKSTENHSINDNKVFSFYEDTLNNYLYIGTLAGGLNRLNRLNGVFEYFPKHRKTWDEASFPAIYSISKEPDSEAIWLGCSGALFKFYPHTGSLQRISKSNLFGQEFEYFAIYHFNDKTVLGTNNGFYITDRKKIKLERLEISNQINGIVRSIQKDQFGRMWATINNYILGFNNPENPELYKINSDKNSIETSCIYAENEEILWFGTHGNGLGRLNLKTRKVNYFKAENEKGNNVIYGILADSEGKMWMSSNKGLIVFNPKNYTFKNISVKAGLQGSEFNRGAYLIDRNGDFLFGGMGGFNKFSPPSFMPESNPPRPEISQVKLFDKLVFGTEKGYEFKFNQNYLRFEFSAFGYENPEENQFAYKMEGLDPDWNYCGTQNFANYTGIVPGNYVFKLKAASADGVWSDKFDSIPISILPPWWQTFWFQFLAVLICVLSIFILIRIYTNAKLQKQKTIFEKQQAVENERKRIAQDLHDDLGSTLGSISVYSEVAKNRVLKNTGNAEEVLLKIGDASREMIEKIGDIVWSVNPENDNLEKMIHRMQAFAATMLTSAQIQHQFKVDKNIQHWVLSPAQRKNLFLIFKEAIYNIVKYSQAKEVSILIMNKPSELTLIIQDNGNGFDTENDTAYNGNGLKNMKSRALEINAHIEIESAKMKGTIISLTIQQDKNSPN